MASPLFLHIGTMKSATTYLQGVCEANVDTLTDAGVLWPGASRNFGSTKVTLDTDPSYSPRWPELAADIAAHNGPVLVSNELLSTRRAPRIEPLLPALEGVDTRVVITARDLGRVIPSQWHTGARGPEEVPSWPDFIEALTKDRVRNPYVKWFWRRQDLPRIIATWSALLPRAPITVVTVPPAGSPTDLVVERFMSLLGVSASGLRPPARRDPPDYLETSEFMRRFTDRVGRLSYAQRRGVVKDVLLKQIQGETQPFELTKVWLTDKQMKWARSRATDMVDAIAQSGVEVVGDLSDLIPPASARTGPPIGDVDDARLLEVAMQASVAVLQAWSPEAGSQWSETGAEAESE